MSDVLFNDQEYLFQVEEWWADRLPGLFNALGVASRLRPNRREREGRSAAFPHIWRLGWDEGTKGRRKDSRKKTYFVVEGAAFVDGGSEYGKPRTYKLDSRPNSGWSQTLRADAIPIDREVDETIEIVEQVSQEYSGSVSISITQTTKAEVKAGVEGVAEANASTELTNQLNTSFGWSSGDSRKSSYKHNIKDRLKVPLGKHVLVQVIVDRKKTVTPVIENGILDWNFRFDMTDWAGGKYWGRAPWQGGHNLTFSSLRYFADMLEGRLPAEYPDMRGFWDKFRRLDTKDARMVQDLHEFATNEQHPMRNVKLRKEVVRVFEKAGSMETINLN